MLYLISPPLKVQKHDTFTTGIIYMPIGLATISSYLMDLELQHKIIDCFGSQPNQVFQGAHYWNFGIYIEDLIQEISDCESVIVYANQASNHESVIEIIQEVRKKYRQVKILVLENTQAVTAYSLKPLEQIFRDAGANGIITGYYEEQLSSIFKYLGMEQLTSSISKNVPIPNWKNFPTSNYWRFKLSHGPFTTSKYLPILTSRGCPFNCSFCVVPATNNRNWIGRPPLEVFNEISYLSNEMGVKEFHLEDLNPTIDIQRIEKIAELVSPLKISWKIVAGTKAETIKNEVILKSLAKSGLRYLSISPESGSQNTKIEIGKRFDNRHAMQLIRWCKKYGVRTQACFVLGMPSEEKRDRRDTLKLIRKFTRIGIDEIAIFIIAPIPGSQVFKTSDKFSLTDVSFSPTWRLDYRKLSTIRLNWYFQFLALKLVFHPVSFGKTIVRFFTRKFELKMELAPYRSRQWKKWSQIEHS
jgi:radical SAM superfamily enzyme YgiQ (UPF0313 family)